MFRVLVGCALLSAVLAVGPIFDRSSNLELFNTNVDEPAYRLLDTVQPRTYFVDLFTFVEEGRFDGIVTIEFDVTVAGLTQVVMHQKVRAITAVTLTTAAGVPIPLRSPDWIEYDNYFELMKVNLVEELPIGSYVIRIVYEGQINENQFDRGFYRGYYLVNGERRYYATTQFQPYHARKAFPCFDEPQFKSRFTIAITRPTSYSQSYSNMAIDPTQTEVLPNDRTREVFYPTPIVSAYLVAFHVSDFIESNPGSTAERPFGVISRPGVQSQHAYAGEIGVALTNWMSNYFDFDYYTMGQGVPMKNDHIALPDFPSGAMENWGMVNYREAYLLYDADNTNIINKIFIATIVAHELAHKWFGNLVTCFWWSNLWLNESFASYFEYFGPHPVDPTLELEDQFVVDYVHSALLQNGGAGALAMNNPSVASNSQITANFGTNSYAKGASVLRMMEHLVGRSTSQKAMQYYLKDNAYGLGTPELLYHAYETAAEEDGSLNQYTNELSMPEIFKSWVDLPGYPVVEVDVDHSAGLIQLRQYRFLIDGGEGEGLWQIPLTYTREGDVDFENTKPIAVMTTATAALPKPEGHEWILFNNKQSGLYRVLYDDHSYEHIHEALLDNHEGIHKLNRAQIVNDILNFVRAGTISTDLAFKVMEFLRKETDHYVWAGALPPLNWIRDRISHVDDLIEEFNVYIMEEMKAVIEELGYNEVDGESTSSVLNRMQIMNMACNLGHEGCIADSQEKWNAFRDNPNQQIPANLRRHVYCVGIRNGDSGDFQFLWQRYIESENTADMVVILRALGCTRSATDLTWYLTQSTTSDHIRYHDRTNAFNFALQGNSENIQTVLNFVYANHENIREGYGGADRLAVAINALTTHLTDYDDVLAFQNWLYANQRSLVSNEFNTGVSVIATATQNLHWGNNITNHLRRFIRVRNSAPGVVASFTMLFSVLLIHIFK